MGGKMIGYARVSTNMQNEDRQVQALLGYGIALEDIVVEKQSGKDIMHRPVFQALLARMQEGDTLVTTSIDRLGRNYQEMLEQWRIIVKERHLNIIVLDFPLFNTTMEMSGLQVLIMDIALPILSYFAQAEREFIRQRQKEGIAAAKSRGVRFGRPKLGIPEDFQRVVNLWKAGKISGREAARELEISHTTFFRWVKQTSPANAPSTAPSTTPSTADAPQCAATAPAASETKSASKKPVERTGKMVYNSTQNPETETRPTPGKIRTSPQRRDSGGTEHNRRERTGNETDIFGRDP